MHSLEQLGSQLRSQRPAHRTAQPLVHRPRSSARRYASRNTPLGVCGNVANSARRANSASESAAALAGHQCFSLLARSSSAYILSISYFLVLSTKQL